MALKTTISNIVGVKVEGVYNDEKGLTKTIDFLLTCERLTSEQIDEALAGDYSQASILRFMLSIAKGWSSVKDDEGNAVAYSEDEFEARCKTQSGLLFVCFKCYREQSGVRAKN